jgi:hypothetical protein
LIERAELATELSLAMRIWHDNYGRHLFDSDMIAFDALIRTPNRLRAQIILENSSPHKIQNKDNLNTDAYYSPEKVSGRDNTVHTTLKQTYRTHSPAQPKLHDSRDGQVTNSRPYHESPNSSREHSAIQG